MSEKLLQAAVITFLLYLLAGFSTTSTTVPTKASPLSEISAPIISTIKGLGDSISSPNKD